ncbi:MBL fold metallo-hydrolase RNA specificity domain-containing protein [Woeseia oceani]|uniref:MBL fold metallo-hydrolase n=1 Tax=Woeseia oceani TaxID=1548547 RepID=A0A193LKL4_9GAMM|nr:MBL fold metallo-hydrolase [Woeseia oceani]ANO52968.1 MBL fold metallo-hydrolase [Woeseia oceani]
MKFELQFFGATEEVTGSLYVIRTGQHTVLLECGLVQGGRKDELRNAEPFPVPIKDIDAVILSHAHIDHSGRVPLLAKRGYTGPVYTQNATRELCSIMLPDSGYLHEKDAEWENRKRDKKGEEPVEALYTRADAEDSLKLFRSFRYEESTEILPGLWLRFLDAGHILGSAIVELRCSDGTASRTLVFTGDLGYRDAPVMEPPKRLKHADAVLMESTYGDRLHRSFDETLIELADIFQRARASKGNILIPAFTVGRTQDLLYLMSQNYKRWGLADWHIYLDSPMGIEATKVYARFRHLYGAELFRPGSELPNLPNFHATMTTEESMGINTIRSGAIIIAGSGMCTGGRIHHHLKNNIDRAECHVILIGFQAHGTLGRRLVDGETEIRLWGETLPVRAQIHTVGGLSAHGDQADLIDWYRNFANRPPLYLVHGEPKAQQALQEKLRETLNAPASIAVRGQKIEI